MESLYQDIWRIKRDELSWHLNNLVQYYPEFSVPLLLEIQTVLAALDKDREASDVDGQEDEERDDRSIKGLMQLHTWTPDQAKRDRELGFSLWLEFEHFVGPDGTNDPEDDFWNINITLRGGQRYALSVWSYGFFARWQKTAVADYDSLGGKYLIPPDLFVERFDRETITEVVLHLIRTGGLRKEWRVGKPHQQRAMKPKKRRRR